MFAAIGQLIEVEALEERLVDLFLGLEDEVVLSALALGSLACRDIETVLGKVGQPIEALFWYAGLAE